MPCKGQVKHDLVGQRLGCMTVLDRYIQDNSGCRVVTRWLCQCRCGALVYVPRYLLVSNPPQCCDQCRPQSVRKERLYHIYHGMLQRCYNPNSKIYQRYGGVGVCVADEWRHNYRAFKSWAYAHGYTDQLTIDRIDACGDYIPSNCRWISLSENSGRANLGRHKNHTKLTDVFAVSPDGERVDITNMLHFSQKYGLCYSSVSAILHGRMRNTYHGWRFHSNKTRE